MAWVEMYVCAPEPLDNPKSIKEIDDELTKVLIVCFYVSLSNLLPVRQHDGTWALRVLNRDLNHLEWIKQILAEYGLKIIREERYG